MNKAHRLQIFSTAFSPRFTPRRERASVTMEQADSFSVAGLRVGAKPSSITARTALAIQRSRLWFLYGSVPGFFFGRLADLTKAD